ncbi:hypothetical protein LTR02_009861 [Friedmanniomyces endolithicus]|nr:hypothetical protein LTR02_009861 [Friedmanniomyces endolithicus]
MLEYKSIDWCHSEDNVGWCPPTIEAILDTISINVATMAPANDTGANHCDHDCLRGKLELASRRAATASMLWAKHKVSGIVWDVNSTVGPDKIDWSIRVLSPSDNFTQELKSDTAPNDKRGLSGTIRDMLRKPRKNASPILLRGQKSGLTKPTANSRELWEPRMQYLLSAPSRLRHDNWLAIEKVRNDFNGVLKAAHAADHFELNSSWLKYLIREWMSGPPTQELKQYVDWWGLDFTGKTLPAEALQKLRGLKVSETVWRWVEDFDTAKVIDPWEGRPDSGKPNVLLRGYQVQFRNETSNEPCYEPNGKKAGSTDNAPSAVIRSAWPFERSLTKNEVVFRVPHTWPWSGARKIEYLGISPPPAGSAIWSLPSGKGDHLQTTTSDGATQGLPIVLQPSSNRPQCRYLGPNFIWGDKHLAGHGKKSEAWCDSKCFGGALRKVNNAAARAAVYGVVTVYQGQKWCTTAKKINVAALVDSATRIGVSYGTWRGQSCLTNDCQKNVSQAATLRTEVAAMVLTKKMLLPHVSEIKGTNATLSGIIVDALIAASISRYNNITGTAGVNKTATSNLTRKVFSSKSIGQRGLQARGVPTSNGQEGGPGKNLFTRFWRSMLGKIQKLIKIFKQRLELNDTNLGEVDSGELEQMNNYLDELDEPQYKQGFDNWLEQTRMNAQVNPDQVLEAPEVEEVEELATYRVGWVTKDGEHMLTKNLEEWTDERIGNEYKLRRFIDPETLERVPRVDPEYDCWEHLDDVTVEQRAQAHLREPTVEELEADDANIAEDAQSVEEPADYYPDRVPADQANIEPAEWKPDRSFLRPQNLADDVSEADFTLDGAADAKEAYICGENWGRREAWDEDQCNPHPTAEEFERAFRDEDPVARSQVHDYDIQTSEGLAETAGEVAEEAVIPEEVAEELIADGAIEVFADALPIVIGFVMDLLMFL